MLTACGETGVELASGRPAMRDVLLAAAEGASRGDTVGVYVGGEPAAIDNLQNHAAEVQAAGYAEGHWLWYCCLSAGDAMPTRDAPCLPAYLPLTACRPRAHDPPGAAGDGSPE